MATSTQAPKTYRLTNSIVKKSVSSIVLHVSLKIEKVCVCVCVLWYRVSVMVFQVEGFVLITHLCVVLAHTSLDYRHLLPLFSSSSSSSTSVPFTIRNLLPFIQLSIYVCACVSMAQLKWPFAG